MIAKGTAPNRISMISYGKERPAAAGSDEAAWSQNRNAEGMVAHTAARHARGFDMAIVGQIDPAHPPLGTRKHVPEALFVDPVVQF